MDTHFSAKGQMIKALGSEGQIISVLAPPLWHRRTKAAVGNAETHYALKQNFIYQARQQARSGPCAVVCGPLVQFHFLLQFDQRRRWDSLGGTWALLPRSPTCSLAHGVFRVSSKKSKLCPVVLCPGLPCASCRWRDGEENGRRDQWRSVSGTCVLRSRDRQTVLFQYNGGQLSQRTIKAGVLVSSLIRTESGAPSGQMN